MDKTVSATMFRTIPTQSDLTEVEKFIVKIHVSLVNFHVVSFRDDG